ncbi:uncharacterized protein LOC128034022 [Gossypium raimondii]|uniref:uncharacterized protein LOC128034022 n=1 Tax=Gossypium raimondii TaxID=29730 RepID=UPI00227C8D5B|nr:uncharacterized protein LOC128034022 [Gossypium raimondii]
MDFVSRLSLTLNKKDSVWVIIDRWTKYAHFISVKTNYSLQNLMKLYISEIVRLHRVPILIISDRDPRFMSQFWKKMHETLGSRLNFSTAFYPQTDEDKVRLIWDSLKVTFDRQKSYTNLKRREIGYSVGDFVSFKVSPWKKLELPLVLDPIHDVFHISILRCYHSDPTHIVLVEEIEVGPDLTFEEEAVQILDRDVKVLRRKSIPLVKVLEA